MSRYASTFESPQGVGDARPTAMQVIKDEGLEGKLSDKVFLITGVSSGIGIETLRAMYATGAHVFGTVRDMEKGKKVVKEIEASGVGGEKKGKISLIEMHMDDLSSVKKGSEDFLKQSQRLDVLVCNAGIMAQPYTMTKDDLESQFGINHIAHFALFQHLKAILLSTATASFPCRVITLSSLSHRHNAVQPNGDYSFTANPSSYDPWKSYAQSKTANIWFANSITKKYASQHLYGLSVHPGTIWTQLQSHLGIEDMLELPEIKPYMMSAGQGAATTIVAALAEEWKEKGGCYLANCVEQGPRRDEKADPHDLKDLGYAEWALGDEEGMERLWKHSSGVVSF